MSESKPKNLLRNLTNSQILVLSLFFMVPGISLAIVVNNPSLLAKLLIAFVTEMGFAIFIAWVIITTVDEREKEKSLIRYKDAERRLNSRMYLENIIDIDIPKDISSEINDYLVTSKFIKEKHNIFGKIESLGEHCALYQRVEALYANASAEPQLWEIGFAPYDHFTNSIKDQYKDIEWGVLNFSVKIGSQDGDVWKSIDEEQSEFVEKDGRIIPKKPILINPGQKILMLIEYRTAKFTNDSELFTNFQISRNIDFTLEYDKSKFTVGYQILHPKPDSVLQDMTSVGMKLNFTHPFLPMHGFYVFWRSCD